MSYLDSLYEMITTPVPLASLVEDTPPNFLTEVENVSCAFSSQLIKCIFRPAFHSLQNLQILHSPKN